ncbi:MAG: hypothetical protein M3Q58_05850 [Bacteroidota bacterium]|nr:hypothetical protein [Bacteroidota bacterium]
MKTNFLLTLTIIFIAFFTFSCKKEGVGGKVELAVFVKHHKELIPNAVVYIKYGAKEFPGPDSENYDDSAICGSDVHHLGHTHFKDLKKGDYYLYSVGYDSTINLPVTGGIPVQIKEKAGEVTVDIPVTEEH